MTSKLLIQPDNANLVEDFRKDCELRNITSHKFYAQAAARFLAWTEKQGLDPLKMGKKELKKYLYHLTDKGSVFSTLEITFAHLNAFYDYLEEENLIEINPIPAFRKRNIRAYKKRADSQQRQIIGIDQAAKLVSAILEARDRAIILLLLKTGLRCHELVELDVENIDLERLTLAVHPTPKRSNLELYFDHETAEALRRWLSVRSARRGANTPPLFLTPRGNRIKSYQVVALVSGAAARVGLHDQQSERLDRKFTPHCCRHWFTTHLIQAGMQRDYVKELRGDARKEAIDIYNHIDKKMLKESYLACIPQLGLC
jgi:integrase/recombinase XerD